MIDSLPDGTVNLLYETYGLSLLRLVSRVPLVRGPMVGSLLLALPHEAHEENAVDAAFNSAKGTYNVYPHSELAVPVEHCATLLDRNDLTKTPARRISQDHLLPHFDAG